MAERDKICVFEVFEKKSFCCFFGKVWERKMSGGRRIYFLLIRKGDIGTADGFKILEKMFGIKRKTVARGAAVTFGNKGFGR